MAEEAAGLTMEQILAVDDVRVDAVKVPEWGGAGVVHVRTLSCADRAELDGWVAKKQKGTGDEAPSGFAFRLAAIAMCDAVGNRLFSGDTVDIVQERNATVMTRVANAALDINAFGEAAEKRAEGNS